MCDDKSQKYNNESVYYLCIHRLLTYKEHFYAMSIFAIHNNI
jgi:hypothetical protein